MTEADRLEELVRAVLSGARYRQIDPGLVQRFGAAELAKGRSFKEAVKETRNKLHQVGGAYQETPPDYAGLAAELAALPNEPGRAAPLLPARDADARLYPRAPALSRRVLRPAAGADRGGGLDPGSGLRSEPVGAALDAAGAGRRIPGL